MSDDSPRSARRAAVMRKLMRLALSTLLALHGAARADEAAAAREKAADEARRWAYAADGRNADALRDFLRRFPLSVHAAEARTLLLQRRLQPQGRLVSGEQCAAIVDERARSLLRGYTDNARFARYDFVLPALHFAQDTALEFRPRDVPAAQVPPEDVIALDLIALRNGGCALHLRWGVGSRLPDACRCEPLQAGYVFESALAGRVLAGYAALLGANAVCKAQGVDHQPDIEAHLDEWLDSKAKWLQSVRDRQQRKAFVLPSEEGEAEDTVFALPQVRQRSVPQPAYDAAQQAAAARTPEALAAFCRAELPQQIVDARLRTLLSTRPLR